MKKYILFICYLFIFYPIETRAQEVYPLGINDPVPDVFLGRVLNEPTKKIRVSDFKGKLLILDFWNIYCSSCIHSMPKMNALQKRFKDRIQIIYVTRNSAKEVNQLFSRIKVKKPDIPFIIDDSMLKAYFPHNGDPFHVWINQVGKVYALTFDYCTDSITINGFLTGEKPRLLRRWDYGINKNYPLVSEQNAPLLNNADSYSIFFKSLIEYSNSTSLFFERDSSNNSPYLLRVINGPLIMFYDIAFNWDLYGSEVNYFNLRKNNRIIIKIKDSSLFFQHHLSSREGELTMSNTYGYEIKVSKEHEKFLYKSMQEDLNRFLPFIADVEKREVKCLVFKRTSNNEIPIFGASGNKEQITYNEDGTIAIQNMPPKTFILNLIYQNPDIKTPIIDESDFSGCLNMVIQSKLSDIKTLNRELQKYGFGLFEEQRKINMLIIKDK